jgi:hypothetical protein
VKCHIDEGIISAKSGEKNILYLKTCVHGRRHL